jgi:DNA polymerase
MKHERPIVHRDYETRSTVDLRKTGAHVYAEDPTTDVICAVWILERCDGTLCDPIVWRPGEPIPNPNEIQIAAEKGFTFAGHNASFEQAIDRHIMGPRYGFPIIPDEQIDCTLARAAIMGLPLDLARLCKALRLPFQKDEAGHRLMLKMCKPRKPRKGEDLNAVLWHESEHDIKRLIQYCIADVHAEIAAGRALFPMSAAEKEVWLLDQRMNNRGVQVDLDFVETAGRTVAATLERLNKEIAQVTHGYVTAVTQVERIKEFCQTYGVVLRVDTKTRRNGEEYETEAIDKEAIEDLLEGKLPPQVRRALQIRLTAGKSSVKKLEKFRLQACNDGRARGTVQYHGAQPGRWAGRGIQLHNVIRAGITKAEGGWEKVYNDLKEINNSEQLELIYGSPIDLVSRMLRGAVVAPRGRSLIFGDYSNVEARGCVWAAGQRDQVELFASGGKIYEEMGAFIYGLSVEQVSRGHSDGTNKLPRFVGKEAILGCGYGMGWRKFQKATKKKSRIILPDEIAMRGVEAWREKNARVVLFWRKLEEAAKSAIGSPGSVFKAGPYSFRKKGNWLQCRLPSGRVIWYYRPTIEAKTADIQALPEGGWIPTEQWAIHYWTVNGVTKQWEKTPTWGGKLLQNCTEGLCRDFLAGAKLRLERAGYTVILSVHDEIITEVDDGSSKSVAEMLAIMTKVPSWAPGFPLKAEGAAGKRYAKA